MIDLKMTANKELEKKTFTKKQILLCQKYTDRKDLVRVLLEDDTLYSLEQVDALLKKFMEGKVN
ncbi:hypothetical protein V6C32_13095 [Desulforamulus ruminis]|uniref:Phage protein n=2 Tax=Desulforamulus ruminis TaxID=1564 RepID=F6DPL1_DESRL|nr:hypothetical protein [Desulforamulus ruminis]AEG59588.1 hypothetical protein Desru_1314 [Desulforamulus ruminis DSM 2154]